MKTTLSSLFKLPLVLMVGLLFMSEVIAEDFSCEFSPDKQWQSNQNNTVHFKVEGDETSVGTPSLKVSVSPHTGSFQYTGNFRVYLNDSSSVSELKDSSLLSTYSDPVGRITYVKNTNQLVTVNGNSVWIDVVGALGLASGVETTLKIKLRNLDDGVTSYIYWDVDISCSSPQKNLIVISSGTGSGTIKSTPSGINCDNCTESFDKGSMVKLTAYPASNSEFAGWAACQGEPGCNSSSGNICNTTMTVNKCVRATFNITQHSLTIIKTGAVDAQVVSIPSGINCGSNCSANFDHGKGIVLQVNNAPNGTEINWSNCSPGSSSTTCSMVLSSDRTVTVNLEEPDTPVDDEPYVSPAASIGSTVSIPGKLYFSGIARDDIGLSKITMDVSGPLGGQRVFTDSVSGTSVSLTSYMFDSAADYANQPGNYTIYLYIKDSSGHIFNEQFNIEVKPAQIQQTTISGNIFSNGGVSRYFGSVNLTLKKQNANAVWETVESKATTSGQYSFTVDGTGYYRVEASTSQALYPQDKEGVTWRETDIINADHAATNLNFTIDQSLPTVKLIFPRVGDTLSGDFALFGTAFKALGCDSCDSIEAVVIFVNDEPIAIGSLFNGSADRLTLSEVLWRHYQTHAPLGNTLSWSALGISANTTSNLVVKACSSLQPLICTDSQTVPIRLAAATNGNVDITWADSIEFPLAVPHSNVTFNGEINEFNPVQQLWFMAQETDAASPEERLPYDARYSGHGIADEFMEEGVYPRAFVATDTTGITYVKSKRFIGYRPAYKGNPETNNAGSYLAALGANVVSGNFFYQTNDMYLEGIGIPFSFGRFYNSLSYENEPQAQFPLGSGASWTHSFEYSLFFDKSGSQVYLGTPDGHWERHAFVDDEWQSMVPGSRFKVVEQGDGSLPVVVSEGVVYVFGQYGKHPERRLYQLTHIVDSSDNQHELTYSTTQTCPTGSTYYCLDSVTDTRKRKINFSYDGAGRLVQVQTHKLDGSLGRSVRYSYDAAGYLKTYTDRMGRVWTYEYGTFGSKTLLTGIINPRGMRVVKNSYTQGYDSEWRVSTQWDAAETGETGARWLINYVSRYKTEVTNPLNAKTTYVIDGSHRVTEVENPGGGKVSQTYRRDTDATVNDLTAPEQITPAGSQGTGTGVTVDYGESRLGNPRRLVDNRVPGNQNRYVDMTWDELLERNESRLTTLKKPGTGDGYKMSYYTANGLLKNLTDPLGRRTTHVYNTQGQLIQTTNPVNGTVKNSYEDGYLTKVTYPDGADETFAYDEYGRIKLHLNRRKQVTTFTYNDNDQITQVKDANGETVVYSYDVVGNLQSVKDKAGNVNTYTYNPANQVLTRTENDSGYGSQYVTRYAYDGLQRLKQTTNSRNHNSSVTYTLDGEIDKTTNPLGDYSRRSYDIEGQLTKLEMVASNGTVLQSVEYQYDEAGRKTQTTLYPTAARNRALVTVYTYNDLDKVETVTDPDGKTMRYQYDALGRVTKVMQGNAVVTLAYTDLNPGQTLTVTDPNQNQTVYRYDALGQLLSRTDALGKVWSYAYDANGNLSTFTDADGQATHYVYDKLDRVIAVQYADQRSFHFEHDVNGNVTQVELRRNNAFESRVTQVFDGLSRLRSRTDAFGNTVAYGYSDGRRNLTDITYPGSGSSRKVTYSYDAAERMQSVRDWLGQETTYSYDATGRIASVKHSNRTQVDVTYDLAGRLTDYVNSGSSGEVIAAYHLTLFDNGNRQSAQIEQPLLPAAVNLDDRYTQYDKGNRLLTGVGGTFQYDDNGNLVQAQLNGRTVQYGYEAGLINERLVSWDDGTDSFSYRYAPTGERVATQHNGVETRYAVDVNKGLPDVLARLDSNNTAQDYFVYGAHGLISRITAGGEAYVYHFDPSANTVAMTDDNGAVVNSYGYLPYGEVTRNETVDNPFEFVGQFGVMAEANSMNYMRARFYDGGLRRFVSQDALFGVVDDGQTLNRYAYTGEPIRYIDPQGFRGKTVEGTTVEYREKRTFGEVLLMHAQGHAIAYSARRSAYTATYTAYTPAKTFVNTSRKRGIRAGWATTKNFFYSQITNKAAHQKIHKNSLANRYLVALQIAEVINYDNRIIEPEDIYNGIASENESIFMAIPKKIAAGLASTAINALSGGTAGGDITPQQLEDWEKSLRAEELEHSIWEFNLHEHGIHDLRENYQYTRSVKHVDGVALPKF